PSFPAAATMLNYHWEKQIGSLEPGKLADVIAVVGDPLRDVAEMQHVRFVMEGGLVARDEISKREPPRACRRTRHTRPRVTSPPRPAARNRRAADLSPNPTGGFVTEPTQLIVGPSTYIVSCERPCAGRGADREGIEIETEQEMTADGTRAATAPPDFLAGGGEAGARMRAVDWSTTPRGAPQRWPQSLKTIVRVLLDSCYAMWLLWGPELTFFCNDAYLPTVGIKRDWVIGARSDKVWEEIW